MTDTEKQIQGVFRAINAAAKAQDRAALSRLLSSDFQDPCGEPMNRDTFIEAAVRGFAPLQAEHIEIADSRAKVMAVQGSFFVRQFGNPKTLTAYLRYAGGAWQLEKLMRKKYGSLADEIAREKEEQLQNAASDAAASLLQAAWAGNHAVAESFLLPNFTANCFGRKMGREEFVDFMQSFPARSFRLIAKAHSESVSVTVEYWYCLSRINSGQLRFVLRMKETPEWRCSYCTDRVD